MNNDRYQLQIHLAKGTIGEVGLDGNAGGEDGDGTVGLIDFGEFQSGFRR